MNNSVLVPVVPVPSTMYLYHQILVWFECFDDNLIIKKNRIIIARISILSLSSEYIQSL
jgi:hypothetical protein